MKHKSGIMRARDILSGIKNKSIAYFVKHEGPGRRERKRLEAQANQTHRTNLKMRSKNQARDKHKMRRKNKARRKRSWKK